MRAVVKRVPWFVLVLFLLLQSCPQSFCLERVNSTQTAPSALGAIDKKVLLKSISLQKLAAVFERSRMRKYKFRKWIDYLGQEASASGFLAATIVGVNEIGQNLDTPAGINLDNLEKGLEAGFVGSIIGASASASQLGIDGLKYIYNWKKGNNPGSIAKKFVGILGELDALMKEREDLINSSPALQKSRAVKAESDLFQFRRDLICKDFTNTLAHEAERSSSQSIYYGFDISRNVTGAISADVLKRGLREPALNEPGNIWLMTSAGLTIAAPWLSTASGKVYRKFTQWRIKRKIKFNSKTTLDDLLSARRDLRGALRAEGKASSVPADEALDALDRTHGVAQARLETIMDKRAKLRRVAFQQKFASAAVGGQLLAFGIVGETAWQRYGRNMRIFSFNRRLLAGNIVGLTATSLAVGATGASAFASELNEWKLKRSHERPEDIVADYLKTIERVEGRVLKYDM